MFPDKTGHTPKVKVGILWVIWVRASMKQPAMIRETIEGGPIGAAFDTAGKIMRDEGWEAVEVIRQRSVAS